ncbi:MAG: tRNA-dihydrouridine synthase [archaeon]|nr:tRNA-dihydrouridine synthase [archaeon]
MWKIGNVEIDGPVVLGPMSGYSTPAYRGFMKPFGVAVAYTEMVSDMGCIYGMRTTRQFIDFPCDGPVALQLFGSKPENILKAAKYALEINPAISIIDVNMGCPVHKVNRTGAGSMLMKDPENCGEIVRVLKKELDVPVTAKIRLGWSSGQMNFRSVISELEAAEVDAICIHPRTREEQYGGKPHYDLVEGLRKEMSVPLIISGNIYLLEDAINAVECTGAEGVMVARGGIGNPYLCTQIDTYFRTGEKLPNPTVSKQVDWCLKLADAVIDELGNDAAMRRLRSYAPHFIAGCYCSREYRNMLTQIESRDDLVNVLEKIRDKLGDDIINNDGRLLQPDDF